MADLHSTFQHGFGSRSDMTDLGRQLHMEVHRALDQTRLHIALQKAVDNGRLHRRKAELYLTQAAALLAQLTSDMSLQDPGWQAERRGETDPVGQLRAAFTEFTRMRPEDERDYASIGRQAIETAHRMLAAVPPAPDTEETQR
jgi:hypothetical protein